MPSGYAVAIVIGVYPFLISWFFNRCLLGVEKKRAEAIEKELEEMLRWKPPIRPEELEARKGGPGPRIIAAITDLARLRAEGGGAPTDLARRVAGSHMAREPRRAAIEVAAWLAGVLVVTVTLGVWPLLKGGLSPLRTLSILWVTREQARESAQILLTGGVITLVSGLFALAWVPLAWRPVRARFGKLLEELAPRLPGAGEV